MIHLDGQLICATPAEAERVRTYLPEHIRLTRAEAGCLSFAVTPTSNPLIWDVAERFTSRAAFEAHQTRAAASPWADATAGIRRVYALREE